MTTIVLAYITIRKVYEKCPSIKFNVLPKRLGGLHKTISKRVEGDIVAQMLLKKQK